MMSFQKHPESYKILLIFYEWNSEEGEGEKQNKIILLMIQR